MSNYELDIDLQKFIIEHLALPENTKFDRNSKLSDCGLDSLDIMDTIFHLEDRYDIMIENAHSIVTYGQLLDTIQEQLEL